MDKSVFLYWWFSFDLWYYLILGGTNNVLQTSGEKILCTLWSLALAKKSCNNISNTQASRVCYFLWLWVNTLPWSHIIKVHLFPFAWSTVYFKYKVWVEIECIIFMFNWFWFFIRRPPNFNQFFWAPDTMH